MIIAGIDEAGRGCVIGPMVLGVVVADENVIFNNVKDSKLLSPNQREKLFDGIKQKCYEFKIIKIGVDEINKMMERKISLNEMEAMHMGEGLNCLKKDPDVVYIDSPDPIEQNFKKRIDKYYTGNAKIVAEHFADKKYPIVSAASILAKVERDAEIEKIKQELGFNFGSGYSSDERTIKFLKEHIFDSKVMKHVRKKWKTVDDLRQKNLNDFVMD